MEDMINIIQKNQKSMTQNPDNNNKEKHIDEIIKINHFIDQLDVSSVILKNRIEHKFCYLE